MTRPKRGADLARRAPRSFGTVERRGERYRAFYRSRGRKVTAPHTFVSVRDARAWLSEQERLTLSGAHRDVLAGSRTFREYANDWLASRTDLALKTADTYRRALDGWAFPDLGGERLDAISPARIRAWHAWAKRKAKEGQSAGLTGPERTKAVRAWARSEGLTVAATGRLSPAVTAAWEAAGSPLPGRRPDTRDRSSAIAQAYRVLHAILATAERDEVIIRNPCRIKGVGSPSTTERTPATPEQVAALAAAMPTRYAAAVTLAAWSGIRSGELRALARRHVDLDAGTVRVERAMIEIPGRGLELGPTKTAGSRRTVALPGFVTDALREHMEAHTGGGEDALLFTTRDGGPLDRGRMVCAFRRARKEVGLPGLRWHDLRHTGASLAYRAGASVPDVQRRLGHTTMRAAQIYAHAYEDADRAVAERLDSMFSAAA